MNLRTALFQLLVHPRRWAVVCEGSAALRPIQIGCAWQETSRLPWPLRLWWRLRLWCATRVVAR